MNISDGGYDDKKTRILGWYDILLRLWLRIPKSSNNPDIQ